MPRIGFASATLVRSALGFSFGLLIAVLASCGGGGGSEPTAAAPQQTASAFTQGTLAGFGSIIVNGIRFDDSAAAVVDDDDLPSTLARLALGMQLEVESSVIDEASATAKALRVRFGSQLTGPVATVDTVAGTITVLGQVVLVDSATLFDAALNAGLSAVKPGAVIEVHGLTDAATGRITATRIEAEGTVAAYKLRGTVASLDIGAKTFKIGSATINYAGVAVVPAALANGKLVRVLLKTTQVAGQWVATAFNGGVPRPAEHADASVHGIVTAFTSGAAFSVNGLVVDAGAATFPNGSANLKLGAMVQVKGSISNGVLMATRVVVEGTHPALELLKFELHGAITAVDATAKTFTLKGVNVSYAGSVEFKGGGAADLAIGRKVEVEAKVVLTDRSMLQATKIEFD